MGNNEAMTPSKTEKLPSHVQDQPAFHPYPDWAAMQAYYGPGVMPPYFSTSIVPGYAPHPYMWAPRPLIPPFGSPYAAIYPNGGYPHPSMPPGPHQLLASTEAVVMATPLNVGAPDTSLGSKDKEITTKLNAAVGNISSNNTASSHQHELSQSGYNSADGSHNGSDGSNSTGGSSNQSKVGSKDRSSSDDRKIDSDINPVTGGESSSLKVSSGVSRTPMDTTGYQMRNKTSPSLVQAFPVKKNGTPVHQTTIPKMSGCNGVPSEPWMQDERTVKREKRKQSNRESARRSRLRKQAENEELAKKVDTLFAENTNLRSEISRLTTNSNALRTENSALLDKLKSSQLIQTEESSLPDEETGSAPSIIAANFLSMIDKPSSISPIEKLEEESRSKPSGKLQQFLNTSPGTDVV
ncbi:G-box-binding factor 3-like isoform X3 [Zingiber officinale]|uniref:G-box-binding factor 3-like isoform X3 n=2 Tax=Zingiber officinale TaxID=94328 RepID=UPI001C4C3BAF|nr:G-box-binding factor 3-like isoform X3 [Zingiber officinale]